MTALRVMWRVDCRWRTTARNPSARGMGRSILMAVAVSKFSSKAQAIEGRARGVQINQPGNETTG